jgi:cold shock CspA family protein
MPNGTVKMANNQKGCGFIQAADGGKDVLVPVQRDLTRRDAPRLLREAESPPKL